MGYITLGILVLTALALLFGMIYGIKRGRNRAILRLILILGCIAGAIFLRPIAVEYIMNFETEQGTLVEIIVGMLNQSGEPLPSSIEKILVNTIIIVLGILVYFILFFALRFISLIILFPLFKLIVRRGKKVRRGAGALVGLIQGIIIAFTVVVPLNGLTVEVNKIAQIEIAGVPLITVPEELGLSEHENSQTYQIYDKIGNWYYVYLTTAKTEDGEKISLSETVAVADTVFDTVISFYEMETALEELANQSTTDSSKQEALSQASQVLRSAGESIDSLDDNSKELFSEILADVKFIVGYIPEEKQSLFDNLTIEKLNLTSVADGLEGLANYFESPTTITQQEVDEIVEGFTGSEFFLDTITVIDKLVYDINVQEDLFKQAVENTSLTEQQKESIKKAFGIS